MNRRIGVAATGAIATLVLAACGITIAQGSASGVGSVLPPQRELLPDQQVQQVLDRFAFGGRPGDAARVRAMGVDRWIALQLHPERIDDRATDRMMASYEMLHEPTSELMKSFRELREARRRAAERGSSGTVNPRSKEANGGSGAATRETLRERVLRDPNALEAARRVRAATTELQSAKLARAVSSERQLQEVMVDFWENHFSVFAGKGLTRFFVADYERDAIRPHALGKFRDLLGAVAKSPAMLYYLDNWRSAADSSRPTLVADRTRRRVPGVRGPATPRTMPPTAGAPATPRRLPPGAEPAGTRRARRATPATRSPTARRPQRRNGLNENYGRELMELHTLGVDGGYTQNDVIEVARAFTGWTIDPRDGSFIFRPAIHDAGEKVVLGHRLAAGRGIEDGEEVLDILASSPATAHFVARKLVVHFVSDSAPAALVERVAQTYMRTDGDIREMIRMIATSPEFFSRAAYRAKVKTPFELVASALRAMDAVPDTTHRTAAIVGRLGQPIFGRQTPDGWPDHGDAWMNTGAILNRINFGLALADGRIPGASLATWPYTDSLAALDRERQVDAVITMILGGEVSPATRRVLVSGENPMLSKYADSADVLVSFDDDVTAPDGAMSGATGFPTLPPMRPSNARVRRRAPASGPAGLRQILGLALGAPEFQRR
ncbi:MAG TPA: DUF1800 domain-containing protein [Gemmatimonadaceae bacterium]|nr:DUF1800 domain-containing protein [Gemmatimonadaceae bacterium]